VDCGISPPAADLDIFDKRVAAGSVDQNSEKPSALTASNFCASWSCCRFPLIASIHGVCLGGGLELALSCDYIIAASIGQDRFGLKQRWGFIRCWAGSSDRSSVSARCAPRRCRCWRVATMRRRWRNGGLINLTVPEESLAKATMAIAEEFAQGPTLAHACDQGASAYRGQVTGVAAADKANGKGSRRRSGRRKDLKAGLASFRKSGPGLAKFRGALT